MNTPGMSIGFASQNIATKCAIIGNDFVPVDGTSSHGCSRIPCVNLKRPGVNAIAIPFETSGNAFVEPRRGRRQPLQHPAIVDLLMNRLMQWCLKRMTLTHPDDKMICQATVVAQDVSRGKPSSTGFFICESNEIVVRLEDDQHQGVSRFDDVDFQIVNKLEKNFLDQFHEPSSLLQKGCSLGIKLFWQGFRKHQTDDIGGVGVTSEPIFAESFRQAIKDFRSRKRFGPWCHFSFQNLTNRNDLDPPITSLQRH